ncbi:hypothetical protein C8J55DRAFT_522074 [Lentinula edodes]|uniref:Uncharacterized protein n=1 Tax=Lentinula lateritia TaxID=40482 RepID=A0A9W9A015_9AGAR|nr:hypothetical protein C8J55DRAFT_522074 [Lentinula edodes]
MTIKQGFHPFYRLLYHIRLRQQQLRTYHIHHSMELLPHISLVPQDTNIRQKQPHNLLYTHTYLNTVTYHHHDTSWRALSSTFPAGQCSQLLSRS